MAGEDKKKKASGKTPREMKEQKEREKNSEPIEVEFPPAKKDMPVKRPFTIPFLVLAALFVIVLFTYDGFQFYHQGMAYLERDESPSIIEELFSSEPSPESSISSTGVFDLGRVGAKRDITLNSRAPRSQVFKRDGRQYRVQTSPASANACWWWQEDTGTKHGCGPGGTGFGTNGPNNDFWFEWSDGDPEVMVRVTLIGKTGE